MPTLHDLPISSKPREKLIRFGVHTLSDADLLALILGSGHAGRNVVDLAQCIIKDLSMYRLSGGLGQLMRYEGVGMAKACAVLAACELGKRVQQKRDFMGEVLCAKDVYTLMQKYIGRNNRECLWGIYLTTRKKVIAVHTIFVGTLDMIVVHPREIFLHALQEHAASVIIVHNHPSGDPTPSQEDIVFTKRLEKAARLLGIGFDDHIIIGDGKYYSFSNSS